MAALSRDDTNAVREVVTSAALARSNDYLKNERDAVLAMLRRLEWIGPAGVPAEPEDGFRTCPLCGFDEHQPDCELAAMLAEGGGK